MPALALLASLLAAAPPRPLPGPFMLGGIQVNEPDHADWVRALERAGFDTVEVTVYARQADWDGSNLWWEDEEPAVLSEIRAAKEEGLRVFLILRVALDHAFPRNRHLWHGQIYPRSEADLEEWLGRYRRFVLKWAEIAEAEGVDALAMGSEMNALTTTSLDDPVRRLARWVLDDEAQRDYRGRLSRHAGSVRPRHLRGHGVADVDAFWTWLDDQAAARRAWARAVLHLNAPFPGVAAEARKSRLEVAWRALATATRRRFTGPVGYAANFDQFMGVGFWDALDFVGVNAYFGLRSFREAPTVDALEAGWARALSAIGDALEPLRRPVVFTELGLTRRAGTTLAPWAMGGLHLLVEGAEDRLFFPADGAERLEERARAITALARAAAAAPIELAGALWWKLTTKPYHRPHEPFALVLGEGDPLEPALRGLAGSRGGDQSRTTPLRSAAQR